MARSVHTRVAYQYKDTPRGPPPGVYFAIRQDPRIIPAAMAHGTPQEVAQKWSQRSQAAAPDYTAGINRVTSSPTAAAAAAVQTWLARLQDPATAQKYVRKLNAVTLEQWKTAAANYGASRYSQGVANKEAKYQAAITPLLQYIDSAVAQVKSMPNATFEDRLQRSRAFQTIMHNYQGTA